MKNQFRIKNLPDPISIKEAATKKYVDNKFNDPSIIKNTTHVDFNDKNLDNVRFVKVNSMPAVGEHLTAKYYVDNAISDKEADQVKVTINSFYLFVPFLIPSTETQLMFKDSIQNSYRIFFDEWYTERRIVTDQTFQVDIGSAQSVNSPKYLICVHQGADRSDNSNKRNNISFFDHSNVRKYFVEIDGVRYPRDSVLTHYGLNDYLDQYKDVKLFYKEYVGEELLSPFISYPDMKDKYPIQVIDLRFQTDHITPKKIQLFEEYRENPANAKFFVKLIRRREIEMISDGNKLIEIKVI